MIFYFVWECLYGMHKGPSINFLWQKIYIMYHCTIICTYFRNYTYYSSITRKHAHILQKWKSHELHFQMRKCLTWLIFTVIFGNVCYVDSYIKTECIIKYTMNILHYSIRFLHVFNQMYLLKSLYYLTKKFCI